MKGGVVLLRVDADDQIGAGHLMRCIALAQALGREGMRPLFVTRSGKPYRAAVAERGLDWVELAAALPQGEEGAFVRAALAGNRAAALVVDRYHLSGDYIARWRAHWPDALVAQVEDHGVLLPGVDLVINPNLYAQEDMYAGPQDRPPLLVGSQYLLLRQEFCRRPQGGDPLPAVAKILVTLGGSDPENNTAAIIRALADLPARPELHVVVGPGFTHPAALFELAALHGHVRMHAGVTDMYQLMASVDLSVNGAGATLWELYYVGVPNLLYVLSDNQERDAAAAAARGLSLSLGSIAQFSAGRLRQAVTHLMGAYGERLRLSRRGREVVDGRGAERVACAIAALCTARSKP